MAVKFNVESTRGASPQLFDPHHVVVVSNYSRFGGTVSKESVERMVAQFDEDGRQLDPGWVTKIPDLYGDAPVLIAGERRLLACREKGWKFAAYYQATSSEAERINLCIAENVRQELTWVDKAHAASQLEKLKWTQEKISSRLGIHPSETSNLLKLAAALSVDKDLARQAAAGQISYTAALSLLEKPVEERAPLVSRLLNEKAEEKGVTPAEVRVNPRDIKAADPAGSGDSVSSGQGEASKPLKLKEIRAMLTRVGGKVDVFKTLFISLDSRLSGEYTDEDLISDMGFWLTSVYGEYQRELKSRGWKPPIGS